VSPPSRSKRRKRPPPVRPVSTFVEGPEDDGRLYVYEVQAPPPSNFFDLDIEEHPPGPQRFRTEEAPYWPHAAIETAFDGLLRNVEGSSATRGISLQILYRPGFSKRTRRDGQFYAYPSIAGEGGLLWFTTAFDDAQKAHKGATPLAAAKLYVSEFVDRWENSLDDDPDRVSGSPGSYIYKLRVALLYNVRRYRKPTATEAPRAKRRPVFRDKLGRFKAKPKQRRDKLGRFKKAAPKKNHRTKRRVRHRNRRVRKLPGRRAKKGKRNL
jgi:hypothetical protein